MSKHTPGPLSYGRDISHSPAIKRNAASILKDGIVIARVASMSEEDEEVLANARLYAAAPEMLEALKAAVECGMVPVSSATEGGAMRHVHQVHVADAIRAAIAKAEGRS